MSKKIYRIWFQGATDRTDMAPYIAKVEAHFKSILDPECTWTFNTTTPPGTTTHALTEYRIGRNFIRNAIEAERQGYDAVAVTHFQDPGLSEAKSAVGIPVLGLGETTLHFACTLGRKLGLVTISPAFIPWHEEQIIKYGLQQRVVGVRAVNAKVPDYIKAFASKAAYAAIQHIVALDLPYVSLWYNDIVCVSRKRISGIKLGPAGDYLFLTTVRVDGTTD